MTDKRKVCSLVLILALSCASLVMIESTLAETQKPSVPEEFHISCSAHPYDVEPTYTTDPYTGEKHIGEAGFHAENRTIEVSIKNQPFTPYKDAEGHQIWLYYNVSYKGHFEDRWHSLNNHVEATDGEFTVLSARQAGVIPSNGGQLDFRVQACIGYCTIGWVFIDTEGYIFYGEASDWSPIQTITIESNQATASPTMTQPPTMTSPTVTSQSSQNPTTLSPQPNTQTGVLLGLDWEVLAIVGLVVVVAVLAVGMVVIWRKLPHK